MSEPPQNSSLQFGDKITISDQNSFGLLCFWLLLFVLEFRKSVGNDSKINEMILQSLREWQRDEYRAQEGRGKLLGSFQTRLIKCTLCDKLGLC